MRHSSQAELGVPRGLGCITTLTSNIRGGKSLIVFIIISKLQVRAQRG